MSFVTHGKRRRGFLQQYTPLHCQFCGTRQRQWDSMVDTLGPATYPPSSSPTALQQWPELAHLICLGDQIKAVTNYCMGYLCFCILIQRLIVFIDFNDFTCHTNTQYMYTVLFSAMVTSLHGLLRLAPQCPAFASILKDNITKNNNAIYGTKITAKQLSYRVSQPLKYVILCPIHFNTG